MKVLLSCYSCDPRHGSEPGVGWNWAVEIAKRGHQVHVITRAEHEAAISAATDRPANLHFHFHETIWPMRAMTELPGGIYPHIYAWQWTAATLARHLHAEIGFDLVHHVTYATARFPSYMGRLGIPFIIGPVGGGEQAPRALRRGLPWFARLFETLRSLANQLMRLDPLVRATLRAADRIYVKTEDTRACLPHFARDKCSRASEIGIDLEPGPSVTETTVPAAPRFLFLGRFIHVKGMHIGLLAFRHILDRLPDARLSMVGRGPARQGWTNRARALGIDSQIDWVDWVEKREVPAIYRRHHAFLFPGLHDSGATVSYEACAHACPIICLKLGGPGEHVTNDFGRVIDVDSATEEAAARRMAEAACELYQNPDLRDRLIANAREWIEQRSWADTVARVYDEVETWMEAAGEAPVSARGGVSP